MREEPSASERAFSAIDFVTENSDGLLNSRGGEPKLLKQRKIGEKDGEKAETKKVGTGIPVKRCI